MSKPWGNCTIAPDADIHEGVVLQDGVHIGKGAIIYPGVEIGSGSFIGPYCTIGEPVTAYYADCNKHAYKKTRIGAHSIVRSHSVIYEDVDIGQNFQCGHRVAIREGTRMGAHCSAGTVTDIQGCCTIGNYVRMHSNVHIGQMSVIEDFVWIYPYVVLTNDPFPPMNLMKGVTIREFAQIATGAILMPGVTIGQDAIVGAGAVVRSDVPIERVFVGVPAKDICSVRTLRDETGAALYPWKEHLKEDRGYPWQRHEFGPGEKA
jgi:acetyltransferase-like isoleucine patch superfamily enzyme